MAKKKAEKKSTATFSIELKVNGETHKASGETLAEALLSLPTLQAKTRAILSIINEPKEYKPISLTILDFKRLFYPGITGDAQRIALEKRLPFFLKYGQ